MTNSYEYKFSVIMPLYNVEEYFEEAIESVIKQTVGFEENIQVILVNDGSPDNIESLCLKYKERYPNNVVYVKKENGGVSSARNEGIKYIKGKYTNFFDPDDRWDSSAFELAYDFLEEYNEVNVVSCRYCFFGREEGFSHALDYKFHDKQVIDIRKEYSYIQMAVNAVFIRSTALKQRNFDVRLKMSEDSVFVTKIILDTCKYGILPKAVYYYRKRLSNDSLIDQSKKKRTWYFDTPIFSYKESMDYCREHLGEVLPYVQYLVMYDIKWRLKAQLPDDFNEDEYNQYFGILKSLLNEIQDFIILSQKRLNFGYKIFALSLKYGYDIKRNLYIEKSKVKFKDLKLFSLRAKSILHISNLKIRNGTLHMEGSTSLHTLESDLQIILKDSNGVIYNPVLYNVAQKDRYAFTGEKVLSVSGFRIDIPLDGLKWIRFELITKDENSIVLAPSFDMYAKIDENQKDSYYYNNGYILKYKNMKIIVISGTKRRLISAEIRYLKNEVLKNNQISYLFYRVINLFFKIFKRTDVWIITDRANVAGDNGEALFAYLMGINSIKHNIYFAIDKNSRDFNRLKSFGKVLKINSLKYKINFLRADKIISSHADMWVNNAFGDGKEYVKDLYDFDYVFLQHGVIQNDLSNWLHKFNKDIALFITSSKAEYESIINGDYGYSENEVKLTGLPRYDLLDNKPKKKIVFLPTWRKSLSAPIDNETLTRLYSDRISGSQYCIFYNKLINDKRLLEVMRNNSYSGEFYLHPAFFGNYNDFNGNEYIKVIDDIADYNSIFRDNSLLITDYSSVAFDFAYMRKPVVYTQFDIETIKNEHIFDEGYFSYENNGFGHICYNYDDTVDVIINYIEHGCVMEQKYIDRVCDFFAWKDRNNCERVYNEILKL